MQYHYSHPDFKSLTEKVTNSQDMWKFLDNVLSYNVQSEIEIIFSDNDKTYYRNETPEGKLIFEFDPAKVLDLYHIDRKELDDGKIEYEFLGKIIDNCIRKYLEYWIHWSKNDKPVGHIIVGENLDSFVDEIHLNKELPLVLKKRIL